MSTAAASLSAAREPAPWPDDALMVLHTRRLRQGVDPRNLPCFGDPFWRLDGAREAAHGGSCTLHWEKFPAALVPGAKMIALAMLENPCPPGLFAGSSSRVLSVSTVYARMQSTRVLCQWLAERGLTSLEQVGDKDLNDYLAHVLSLAKTAKRKCELLTAVTTAWGFRRHLPTACRFATDAPFGGASPHELTRPAPRSRYHATPRIAEETMQALLAWSLHFVEDFAPEIIAAWTRYQELRDGSHASHARYRGLPLGERINILLEQVRATGELLPARALPDGGIALDRAHVRRLINFRSAKFTRAQLEHLTRHAAVAPASLGAIGALAGGARIEVPITAQNVKPLVRHLVTACFVVVCYLSGMRPGEALNLRRGCRDLDPDGQLLLTGDRGKVHLTARGDPAPSRTWTVVAPVHTAIAVLEALCGHRYLFPSSSVVQFRARMPRDHARTVGRITEDIGNLISWVNETFDPGALAAIPPDPVKHIHPRRLRRTLAYFIVRRPRGLIAAALQYGHVSTRVTLSYAGAADDSWLKDIAVERLEMIVDQVERDQVFLEGDEHVSGSAAQEYRNRVGKAAARFAGRVVVTVRGAERLLAQSDPAIYHGEAMTCVWRAETASCRKELIELGLVPNEEPDESRCRSDCLNLAYTDRDIDQLRERLASLEAGATDPLSPRPQRERAAAQAATVRDAINRHEQTRPGHGNESEQP